jgi:hypothetical protein
MPVKRVCAVFLIAGFAWASQATPAWAHVKVEATPSQAGAANAQLTFRAAAESKTAGITKLEFLADPAMPVTAVTLVGSPVGWQLRPGDFGGFIVEGGALAVGEDAKVTIEVKQLPRAPKIIFKVLQTYSDGRIDRWTDLPSGDGKEPEHPVAILDLAPAGSKPAAAPKAAAPVFPATPKVATPPVPPPAPAAAAKPGDKREPEVAGESLARTGSGAPRLALAAGLLLLTGGAGIGLGAGRRRRG